MDLDLEACARGDKQAWDALVARYAGLIFTMVERVQRSRNPGIDRGEIEDSVQEVFVRLLRDRCRLLRTYDPARASLATWLALISRSVAIDQLRKRGPAVLPLQPDDAQAPARPPAAPADVPRHVLTARQQLVVRMLFDEAMSVPEAARLLGVDAQTIRSTKHKALSRLREILAADATRGDEQEQVAV